MNILFQDWAANRGNLRSQLVLVLFRGAHFFHRLPHKIRWIGFPWLAFYELFVIWILGIELNYKATIGSELRLFHGVGTVIHESAILGKKCILRHGTTIGSKKQNGAAPIIGDQVDIGCQSILLGAIRIGSKAIIGAGSVVLQDIPEGSIAVGNPARLLEPSGC